MYARGAETLGGSYYYLDLTALGRQEDWEEPKGRATAVRGILQGTLTTERRGGGGFGYDSIFVPSGSDLTFAEMSSEQKNAISHRRLTVEELRKGLGISNGRIQNRSGWKSPSAVTSTAPAQP